MVNVSKPEVIIPESAHFSFGKICSLLRLKPVRAGLDSSYRVDPSSVERCLNKNTIAVIGTAGTAELGVIDPIDKLSKLALDHGVYLHVDAAFGGLIIPFIESAPEFDFRLAGVKSITVDPHKMGMATIPAGGILFRDRTFLEHIKTETPYLTEDFQYTFVGTRSGASVAATWAAFESLGREGFRNIVKRCIKLTEFLSLELESQGFKLVSRPTLNIVAFRCANSKLLIERLRERGWFVSYIPRLDCVRIVVMPHLRKQHIVAFLKDLSEIAANHAVKAVP
jgi:tyrosine decarboxylase/aspartate 1-decarboxylase